MRLWTSVPPLVHPRASSAATTPQAAGTNSISTRTAHYTILFGQWLAEGIARYTPLVVSQSEEIRPTVNEIGLVCQDDVLTPYVNSVQLRQTAGDATCADGGSGWRLRRLGG